MVGLSPAWKRHLYRKHRSAVRSSKTTSINDNSPTNNAEVLMSSNHVSSEIQINDPSTNVRLAVDQLKSFSIGTLAGLLGSLAGMGGGFVMIPLMTAARSSLWRGGLGVSQHQAHGTSLFAVGTTGLAGALGYGIQLGSEESDITSSSQRQGLVELDTAFAWLQRQWLRQDWELSVPHFYRNEC